MSEPLDDRNTSTVPAEYEPPALVYLGSLHELTLHGCLFGKQLGGTDGFTFMGISVPISNCSP